MLREDVLARYSQLRAISNKHHNDALKFISRQNINRNARSLGMMVSGTIVADSEEEMALLADLCVYGTERGRSRALDRYRQAARAAEGSSDARVLDAMSRARFSLWRLVRPHEVTGTIVFDVLRERETWLMDKGLEASGQAGMVFAARLSEPEDFSLTCGVIAPIDELTLLEVADQDIARRCATPGGLADDPRFAVTVYRAALTNGMMDIVRFQ